MEKKANSELRSQRTSSLPVLFKASREEPLHSTDINLLSLLNRFGKVQPSVHSFLPPLRPIRFKSSQLSPLHYRRVSPGAVLYAQEQGLCHTCRKKDPAERRTKKGRQSQELRSTQCEKLELVINGKTAY